MLINGEKWACEACVRGHRVSNCQHTDRPLQHINKKGRPVSQCSSCRSSRKSRAAHVKCDCGSKPSKCVHLQPTLAGHTDTCCCNHGGVCTCCSKKSSLSEMTTPDSLQTEQAAAALSRSKSATSRASRTASLNSPPRSGVSKPVQLSKSGLRGKVSSVPIARANSMGARRKSGGALRNIATDFQPASSGDTTPENGISESGSPVRSDYRNMTLQSQSQSQSQQQHPAPLDMSRIPGHPAYASNTGFDLFGFGGFGETEEPIHSAGICTPSTLWSNSDMYSRPGYDYYNAAVGASFDFGVGPSDQFSEPSRGQSPDLLFEQFPDQPPTLAATGSCGVSETDDHYSPGSFNDNNVAPHPEIFDDASMFYTFDEEFRAMHYDENSSHRPGDKHRADLGYWAGAEL